jgi:hypothetical protein
LHDFFGSKQSSIDLGMKSMYSRGDDNIYSRRWLLCHHKRNDWGLDEFSTWTHRHDLLWQRWAEYSADGPLIDQLVVAFAAKIEIDDGRAVSLKCVESLMQTVPVLRSMGLYWVRSKFVTEDL